jgi:formate--tetrahydrofolate ligase
MPLVEKILRIATQVYGARGLDIRPQAERDLAKIEEWGYNNIGVCMAKTQYSFSHDLTETGAPTEFELPIRQVRLNAGAGFAVAVCGNILTMPGLPKQPAANSMDIDSDGRLTGVLR